MEMLQAKWDEGKFVCVGLDSDMNSPKFPVNVPTHPWVERAVNLNIEQRKQLSFNCWIIDATKDMVCAYKPNLAFYRGAEGKSALRMTIRYIRLVASDVVAILDAKQADIDNTNDGYIADDFTYYDADAVTVHPYLGMEAMKPFLDCVDKGIIVLCRTSNKGAGELQDVPCTPIRNKNDGRVYSTIAEFHRENGEDAAGNFEQVSMPLYQFVAHRVTQAWNRNGNCIVVLGATYPGETAEVLAIIANMAALFPGIGAQGGKLEATIIAGQNSQKQGMIVNNSRGVIFAYSELKQEGSEELKYTSEQFAEAAGEATLTMHNAIKDCLAAA